MKVIKTVQEIRDIVNDSKRRAKTVGFVPTMGFLHEGHLSLVHTARQQNDIVVMSIFVNPAQFGPNEDFKAYPRNEERDIKLAKRAGVDTLFIPTQTEMYPHHSDTRILPGAQATSLCGSTRPGHFDGVLKVVLKLFNIINADHSYFGIKDAQQLAIIESFVQDFNINTKIIRVPTVREEDGLAKSSRNINLSQCERAEAHVIQEALQLGKMLFKSGTSPIEVETEVSNFIKDNCSGTVDYVSLLGFSSLSALQKDDKDAIIACAVKFENTRLIDNIIITLKGEDNV